MTAIELMNVMVPEHDRTQCSDDNPINAYANDKGVHRCTRCILIQSIIGGFPKSLKFDVVVTDKTITDRITIERFSEQMIKVMSSGIFVVGKENDHAG